MGKVVIISGSPSKTSRLNGIIRYADESLQRQGLSTRRIDVADLPAQDLISANFQSEAIREANAHVETADAVVISSPVYKGTYTGVLKTYLDLLPQKGLAGKIALPIFIGGTIAHLLSIEYGLKPLLSLLGARHILAGVYVVDTQVQWTGDGRIEIADEIRERLDASLAELAEAIKGRPLTF